MKNQSAAKEENIHGMLFHPEKLPSGVVPLLKAHLNILTKTLSNKLIGIYVHGSAAMGCFHAEQSDLDYLVVVSDPLEALERKTLAKAFLSIYGKDAPAKGVEMSIVLSRFAGTGFRYPTPYEFHMGTPEQILSQRVPQTNEPVDEDLAAHFTMVRKRGLCVYGKPIREVFAEVPRPYFIASIVQDFIWSYHHILEKTGDQPCPVPLYAVLNSCRMIAFLECEVMLSKAEGGQWGLNNLPARYYSLITEALKEYSCPFSSDKIDPGLLKEFAHYTQAKINTLKT